MKHTDRRHKSCQFLSGPVEELGISAENPAPFTPSSPPGLLIMVILTTLTKYSYGGF